MVVVDGAHRAGHDAWGRHRLARRHRALAPQLGTGGRGERPYSWCPAVGASAPAPVCEDVLS